MSKPASKSPSIRLDSIQALRGVAATFVLLLHLAATQRQNLPEGVGGAELELTHGFWDGGWNGVDLFFVISGFIMVYVTRNRVPGVATVKQFLWSRVTRIYPLWWVCAGIMALYFWVSYGMPAPPDRASTLAEGWLYALKSFSLFPQVHIPLLGAGWTLIHEMFFYVIFAISLLFARKKLTWVLLIWAASTLLMLFIFGPVEVRGGNPLEINPIYRVIANPMSLEFIAGAFAALLFLKYQDRPINTALLWGIVIVTTIYVFFVMQVGFDIKGVEAHMRRTLVYAIPSSLLVFALPNLEMRGHLRVPKAFSCLGDWSYSLYLSHGIVLVTILRVLGIMDPYLPEAVKDLVLWHRPGALNNIIFSVITIALCLIAAWLFYQFIERPTIKFFRGRSGRSR